MNKDELFKRLRAIFKVKGELSALDESQVQRPKMEKASYLLLREREAKELLKNSVFIDTFNELKSELLKNWKTSQLNESGMREFYYLSYKILEMIETRIKIEIDNANVERLKRGKKGGENA